ncbi:MAG: DNA methyltransferase [Pseudolabrys sp.]
MLIDWVVERPGLRLGLGDSVNYEGDADLAFSHLYGPLPRQLVGKPAIINVFGNKKTRAEEWCGAELHEVSKWGRGLTNTIYVANMPHIPQHDLRDLVEDDFGASRGWFPDELCEVLLIGQPALKYGGSVFDGFMGRGTVGMICQRLKTDFVGIDRDPVRVQMAREYLGC